MGQALGQISDELVVFTVDAADVGHGIGLAAAVLEVVDAILAELPR